MLASMGFCLQQSTWNINEIIFVGHLAEQAQGPEAGAAVWALEPVATGQTQRAGAEAALGQGLDPPTVGPEVDFPRCHLQAQRVDSQLQVVGGAAVGVPPRSLAGPQPAMAEEEVMAPRMTEEA